MPRDLNLLRPDHPNHQPGSPSPSADHYTGDFNTRSADIARYNGHIFADGHYGLPDDLKASALSTGTFLLGLEKARIQSLLPGLSLKNGEPTPEHVASYLLALAMDTYRPNNMQRVLNPRKYGAPREVESKFNNFFDTSKPLDEAGLAVARQIYGDNFDKSIGTTNPSDDLAFAKLMQKLLPPPGR